MIAPSPHFLVHPSPVGDILIVTLGESIVSLHPFDAPLGVELDRVGLALGAVPEVQETDAAATAVAQLDEYFEGERHEFALPLDWRFVRGFTRDALQAVRDIPFGETASYGEVAIMAGSPGAARAVGTACARTPFSIVVPVHRVVRADGTLGAYGRRPEVKRFLAELEREVRAGSASGRASGAGV